MSPTIQDLAPVWTPHPGQREFLECEAPVRVLACGRRWGKTDACAASIVLSLLGEAHSRHLLLAPTLAQAELLFDRVVELLDRLGLAPRVRRTPYPRLEFGEHRVSARSGHIGRNLRGQEATHVLVDEAAFVPESLVTEVAMPMLATSQGKLTLISTPCGQNHFWRFFQMGQTGENGGWSRRATTAESPFVRAEFLDLQRELISERAYRVEYEASFEDAANRVFPTELVDAAIVRRVVPPDEGRICIGIDWARYTDYTALAVVQGTKDRACLIHLERWNGLSWTAQIERVAAVLAAYPEARVVADATGTGDFAIEQLRRAAPFAAVEEFLFTATSKQSLIEGLAWMFERMALTMRSEPELRRELAHFEATPRPHGLPKLAAAGSFHDDLVVALALAVHSLPASQSPTICLAGARRFSARRRAALRRSARRLVLFSQENP